MGYKTTSLEEFVADATATLSKVGANLEQLAQAALLNQQQPACNSEEHPSIQTHLNKVSQQLVRLSEETQFISHYLNDGLDAPLINDTHWPLIRVLQNQEEAQTQLARELEHTVGQLLANSVFELASCQHLLGVDEQALASGLSSLQHELEQGLTDTRWFIANLEPGTILGSFGLGDGVRRYLEKYENRTKLSTKLHLHTNVGGLPKIIETAIFRILQETLNNVHLHARAKTVDVTIEDRDAHLIFTIVDDGQGFAIDEVSHTRKNFGLARMVDYTELLNGTLKIYSGLSQGTKVILSVPYPKL